MILGQGDWQFEVDENWGQQQISDVKLENAHALVQDKDKILLVTDNPANNIVEYDFSGQITDGWGTQWPGAHGLEIVEEEGETFLFIVDSGWIVNPQWDGVSTEAWDSPFNKMIPQAGSVAKTTRNGRVLFSLGHPQTLGVYTPDMPFNPTDVTVASNGDIYVIDGYGSDFILQYNAQGQFIRAFGKDSDNPEQSIKNGHGITIDRRGEEPLLLASSRADHALIWFTLSGEFVRKLTVPGAYIHAPIFYKNHMLAAVCWTGDKGKPEDNSGVVCIFDESDTLVSVLGGDLPEHGEAIRNKEGYFYHCHGLLMADDGNLYLGQWKAGHLHPMKLTPCVGS